MNHTIATLALTLLLGSGIPSQARSDRPYNYRYDCNCT